MVKKRIAHEAESGGEAHLRAESDTAAHEQGGPARPTPGLARPLLVERLPAAAADLGARQRAGCASVGGVAA
jgi:hypothetical protein